MWWLLILLTAVFNAPGALQQRAVAIEEPQPTYEVDPLKIVAVYGERADAEADIHLLTVMIERPAYSTEVDLKTLVVRYESGEHVQSHAWNDARVTIDSPPSDVFSAEWTRGDGANGTMAPGDLVQLRFVPPSDLPERADVRITLVPETGRPSVAEFRTPRTYSTDTTITLR